MKKVPQKKVKQSIDSVNAIGNFSTRTFSRIFSLILFFLITPLVLFNLLWIFDAQRLVLSDIFLNLVFFSWIFYFKTIS